jgi:ketosteroid isomerase-like protein
MLHVTVLKSITGLPLRTRTGTYTLNYQHKGSNRYWRTNVNGQRWCGGAVVHVSMTYNTVENLIGTGTMVKMSVVFASFLAEVAANTGKDFTNPVHIVCSVRHSSYLIKE